MKRLWTKYLDRITTIFINQPYMYALLAVMFGLFSRPYLSRHDTDLADPVLGYSMLFMAVFFILFLARAVDKLRDGDSVSRADDLDGLHLKQK